MGGAEEPALLRQRPPTAERVCIVNSGLTYDVTKFVHRHPGGREVLVKHAGQDVTQIMQMSPHKHSSAAYAMLRKYRIGDSDEQQVRLTVVFSFPAISRTTFILLSFPFPQPTPLLPSLLRDLAVSMAVSPIPPHTRFYEMLSLVFKIVGRVLLFMNVWCKILRR